MASLENRQKTIEAHGLWLRDCDSHPPQLRISAEEKQDNQSVVLFENSQCDNGERKKEVGLIPVRFKQKM